MTKVPMPERAKDELSIVAREDALRDWLTQTRDTVDREIDGLDVGWGGVQRWATARMPDVGHGLHLDFACGVGTFLAQLGWRFPRAELVGLNIDFAGPHAPIRGLLARARVRSELVQADARRMPFDDRSFDSVSCFLGLQDIEIGFGERGIRAAVAEAVRVLRRRGVLTLLDEFPFERIDRLVTDLPVRVAHRGERALNVRWSRKLAERAIEVYADGWKEQVRPPDPRERRRIRAEALARMRARMERQLASTGFYVPFEPVRMAITTLIR